MNLSDLPQGSRLCISFSGGETSAYMCWRLMEGFKSRFQIRVSFANTGLENEETLEFVQKCDEAFGLNVEWIEAVIEPGTGTRSRRVDFHSASRNGEPFEALIKKYGIPNQTFPSCTRELKTAAMRHYRKDWWPYWTAIGIRWDEFDRRSVNADANRLIYPLIEWKIQKADVNRFWAAMPFRLNLKGYEGNCKTCWKKSDLKLATIAAEHPDRFDFFRRMESQYEYYRPESQPNRTLPARFFRGHKTVNDITAMSLTLEKRPKDDRNETTSIRQIDIFESGCTDSCEAF